MTAHTYGKLSIEKKAEDSAIARNIVQTILDFGVSQQQIIRVAYLLSLELENRETMIKVSEYIKQFLESVDNNGDVESSENNILTT